MWASQIRPPGSVVSLALYPDPHQSPVQMRLLKGRAAKEIRHAGRSALTRAERLDLLS
jgi:hypothetical protein